MIDLINLFEFEKASEERLAPMTRDYYASGAHDEITLRDNHAAYDRISLYYRTLVDVSRRDLSISLFGQTLSMPVLIAPTAFQRLAHPEGEIATARAAGKAGTVMVLSTLATSSIEEVREAATGPTWFQLYVYKDRGASRELVARAEAAGCSALVLTVDAPVWGRRERDVRNRFSLPEGLSVKNLMPAGKDAFPVEAMGSGLAAYMAAMIDQSLSWKDLDWLASVTRLPVLIKGVVRGDDGARAVDHGARGVVVSNHGGRQLDTSPATIDALPGVVEAVQGRIPVLVDGGIRRGTDVVKALARGAKAVLIGRPVLWGLSVGGEEGVSRVLGILRDEVDLAMGLCGCPSITAITGDLLGRGEPRPG
ncbi:MAG: alpha-hydroxy acid oxidase [Byssovorax sp.]